MKPWPLLMLILGGLGFFWPTEEQEDPYILLLGGSNHGYLTPCGCTKPMMGGIKRRAAFIRSSGPAERTIVLENGRLVEGVGRQDEMKAETLAEALASVGVTAINLTSSEARLGRGMVLSLSRLSGGSLVSTAIGANELDVAPYVPKGPFLIGGATTQVEILERQLGAKVDPPAIAAKKLVDEAAAANLLPILMLEGGLEEARAIAKARPELGMVLYSGPADAPARPETEGKTLLATSGQLGKQAVRMTFEKGAFAGYQVAQLGPEIKDDPEATRKFENYLRRVSDERLLDKLARAPGPAFLGSKACGSCHSGAYASWKESEHAHALKTLEDDRHDRDPDCVGCHVVGLTSQSGFKSRQETPHLADVGCESCHGAGAAHAKNPTKIKMGPAGEKSCMPCHTPTNSPGFDFPTYWSKIDHR